MKKLLVLLMILGSTQMFAQNVLVSSGGTSTDFSWSIGQVVTESIITDGYTVSQGFAQAGEIHLISIESIAEDITIAVYPNPVADKLFVETSSDTNYVWQITDILGRPIKKGEVLSDREEIDMFDCSAGQYILTVKSDKMLKSVIIIKK